MSFAFVVLLLLGVLITLFALELLYFCLDLTDFLVRGVVKLLALWWIQL